MTLLTEPTRIVLAKGYDGFTDDADATAYLAAVQAADGQVLEPAVRLAVNSFIKGCKADGIWSAIKASCILAGARTLTGALVPLAGTAPTNNGPFVSGDYNRKTGLVGDGSTKYLNSNRNNNADPQNNNHIALLGTRTTSGVTQYLCGGRTAANDTGGKVIAISGVDATNFTNVPSTDTGETGPSLANGQTSFIGASRSLSSAYIVRCSGTSQTNTRTSGAPINRNIWIFGSNTSGSLQLPTNARLAFYSIGESLNLALLDARVTDLINAFAAAIP